MNNTFRLKASDQNRRYNDKLVKLGLIFVANDRININKEKFKTRNGYYYSSPTTNYKKMRIFLRFMDEKSKDYKGNYLIEYINIIFSEGDRRHSVFIEKRYAKRKFQIVKI